jgi:hypothetical protein
MTFILPLARLGAAALTRGWCYQPKLHRQLLLRRSSRCQLGETPEVLSNRRESGLILGAAWPTQTQSRETQDAFQMRKQHLDTFAIAPGLLEGLGLGQGTSNVATGICGAIFFSLTIQLRVSAEP